MLRNVDPFGESVSQHQPLVHAESYINTKGHLLLLYFNCASPSSICRGATLSTLSSLPIILSSMSNPNAAPLLFNIIGKIGSKSLARHRRRKCTDSSAPRCGTTSRKIPGSLPAFACPRVGDPVNKRRQEYYRGPKIRILLERKMSKSE